MEDNYEMMIFRCSKPLFGQETTAQDDEKFVAYYDKMVPFLEKRLEEHGRKYIAGTDTLTIADLKVYQGFTAILDNIQNPAPDYLKDYARGRVNLASNLKRYLDNLKQEMTGWMQNRVNTAL